MKWARQCTGMEILTAQIFERWATSSPGAREVRKARKPAYPLGPHSVRPRRRLAGGCAPSDPGDCRRRGGRRRHPADGPRRRGPGRRGRPLPVHRGEGPSREPPAGGPRPPRCRRVPRSRAAHGTSRLRSGRAVARPVMTAGCGFRWRFLRVRFTLGIAGHEIAVGPDTAPAVDVAGALSVAPRPAERRCRSALLERGWERPPISACLDRHRGGWRCASPSSPPLRGRSQPAVPPDWQGILLNSLIMNELRNRVRWSLPHYFHRNETDFLGPSWT